MSEEVILTNVENKVATLTFNRPDKLNALSRDLIFQAIETLKGWSKDETVGAIIITGAGRGFCAGGDVAAMAQRNEGAQQTLEEKIDWLREGHELSWTIYNMPKVTIAAVNGHAMGAGLGVALSCDIRIAMDTAKFGTAYAKVGFGGDFGTTWLLTQYVGAPKAKELFFLSDIIEAREAHQLGLVNRVVVPEDFQATVADVAARIANGPLTSFRYMKANVNLSATVDFRTMLDRESETHIRCGETADHQEGVRAFMEKRAPKFTGK
ncbi:MAG: enoyl-CoA hydratase [Acidobacteria bacterium]|nr:enoyl-CoA hydratase [Acidobacteriota bacterium]